MVFTYRDYEANLTKFSKIEGISELKIFLR